MEDQTALSWRYAADVSALRPNRGLSCIVGEERVALFLVDGEVFALRDLCPHQGALLSEGAAYAQDDGDPVVVCPVHYWMFSLRDGHSPSSPAFQACTYPVKVEEEQVLVGLAVRDKT
jgi:3-phenylpropionate/trans-cinnamate dioxygenase ferredoxin component